MARPTKLNKEITDELVTYIKAGNYIETACALVGISKNTVYDWLKRGSRAIEESHKTGKKIPKREQPYAEFSDAVKKAMAFSEAKDLMTISEHAKHDWKAAAWRLERKYPNRWGRKERLDATIEHSGKIEQNHSGEIAHKIAGNEKALDLAMELFDTIQEGKGND